MLHHTSTHIYISIQNNLHSFLPYELKYQHVNDQQCTREIVQFLYTTTDGTKSTTSILPYTVLLTTCHASEQQVIPHPYSALTLLTLELYPILYTPTKGYNNVFVTDQYYIYQVFDCRDVLLITS